MKLTHHIELRVFSRVDEGEDTEKIKEQIRELFPFDFEKEKIKIKEENAYGFEDNKIKILTVSVDAQRHTNTVLKNLMDKLDKDQKDLLWRQIESRLDDELHFYLRLDKEKLPDGKYCITESGHCFRFDITIAAFPHERTVAKDVVKKILELGK